MRHSGLEGKARFKWSQKSDCFHIRWEEKKNEMAPRVNNSLTSTI